MKYLIATIILTSLIGLAAVVAGDDSSPRVIRSMTGMEGMTEVKLGLHLDALDTFLPDRGWLEPGVGAQRLESDTGNLLREVPGLTVVEGPADERMPRLLVTAVAHIVTDSKGTPKDVTAVNLILQLNQEVSLRRPLPGGQASLLTATTWQRSVLFTCDSVDAQERTAKELAELAH